MPNTFPGSTVLPAQLWAEMRSLLVLALPLAVVQLSQVGISVVDTAMMGLLGSQVLAAGALGAVAVYTLINVCRGLTQAVNIFAAEAFGAKNTEKVSRIIAQGFWLAGLGSIPVMLLLWFLPVFLLWLGLDATTVMLTQLYLHAIVWGFPAAFGLAVLEKVSSALNTPQIVTRILFLGAVLNGFANYGLIFGKWGLPALGIAGVGYASTIVLWFDFIITIAAIEMNPQLRDYKLFNQLHQFDLELFGQIVKIGWPLGMQNGADMGLFSITAVLMGYLGTAQLAANEIAFQTTEVMFVIPLGISYALTTRVGQIVGGKKIETVPRTVGIAAILGGVLMGVMGLGLIFFPDRVLSVYLDIHDLANTETVEVSRSLFPVVAVFQFFFGLNLIANATLMGLKDTRTPMLMNLCAYWLIGGVMGYSLAFVFQKGATGLWWGLTFGWAIATFLLALRFYFRFPRMMQSSPTIDPS